MRKISGWVICLLLSGGLSFAVFAQEQPAPVSAVEQKEVIQSLSQLLNDNYVYPEHAQKMSDRLAKNLTEGKYNGLTDVQEFVEAIQQDIRADFDDKHLRFQFSPEEVSWLRAQQNASPDPEAEAARARELRRINYGFEKVEILPGNIGYLKLNGFVGPEVASETAVAAMNFLGNTDAIIFDLRQNGGGSPQMIQLISSYLFDSEPVHLSGFYWRPDDIYTQNWTLPYVPGKRMPDTEVYILTSGRTFSAAEEFSYNLKHLERATIVGEVTGGGAHPGGPEVVNDRFTVWLPSGRSTNPITDTNWEGVGVIPHIEVSADQALAAAKVEILEKLSAAHEDAAGDVYRWYLTSEKAALKPVEISPETLQTYTGTYGPRTLTMENGALYYQRGDGTRLKLKPLDQDVFELEQDNSFRMQIVHENGNVVALKGMYDNGHTDQHARED